MPIKYGRGRLLSNQMEKSKEAKAVGASLDYGKAFYDALAEDRNKMADKMMEKHHSGKGTRARLNTAAEKHLFNIKRSSK